MDGYSVGSLAQFISLSGVEKGSPKKRKQISPKGQVSKKAKNGKQIKLRNGRQVNIGSPIFEGKKLKKQMTDMVGSESDGEGSEDDNEEDISEGDDDEALPAPEIKTDSEDSEEEDEEADGSSDEDLDEILAEDDNDDDDDESSSEDELLEKDDADKDKKPTGKNIPAKNSPEELERSTRTVFIGNLPIKVTKIHVKKLLKKFGKIESVRLRCIPVSDTRVPKKVAMIKKDFHPDRDSLHAYARFETKEQAEKAVVLNGFVYKNHHLRVNLSNTGLTHEENKSIFVGNIPFNAEDEELWKIFEPCGKIVSVRLVRDSRTMIGKGFGYVNFASSDSVEFALEMSNIKLKNRELRVKRSNIKEAKKSLKPKRGQKPRFQRSIVHAKEGKEKVQEESTPSEKFKPVSVQKKAFQGKKSDKTKNKKIKKKKVDPKMKIAKQLVPNKNTST